MSNDITMGYFYTIDKEGYTHVTNGVTGEEISIYKTGGE